MSDKGWFYIRLWQQQRQANQQAESCPRCGGSGRTTETVGKDEHGRDVVLPCACPCQRATETKDEKKEE